MFCLSLFCFSCFCGGGGGMEGKERERAETGGKEGGREKGVWCEGRGFGVDG